MLSRMRISIGLACFALLIVLTTAPLAQAQAPPRSVLRQFWNAELTEMLIDAAVGDTLEAYLVLEPDTEDEFLLSCEFLPECSRAAVIAVESELGEVTRGTYNTYVIVPDQPVALTERMVIGRARFLVTSVYPVGVRFRWSKFTTENEIVDTYPPFNLASYAAWLNTRPAVGFVEDPQVQYGPTGIGTARDDTRRVYNNSQGPLFLNAAALDDSPDFSILAPARLDVLGMGNYVTVKLGFQPVAMGPRSTTAELATGVALEMSGSGREPIHELYCPAIVDFAPLGPGASGRRVVQIFNFGDFPEELTVDFADSCAGFSDDTGPYRWVAPGVARQMTFEFTPQAEGRHDCTAAIAGGLLELPFTGEGLPAAEIVEVTPTSVTFEPTWPGVPMRSQVTIANHGYRTRRPDPVVEGPDGIFMVRMIVGGMEIPAASEGTIDLLFTPLETGLYTGTIKLGDGLPDVPVSGLCAENVVGLQVDPPVLELRFDTVGEVVSGLVMVTNSGLVDLEVDPFGFHPMLRALEPLDPFNLSPGQSRAIQVTMVANAYGRFTMPVRLNADHDLGFTTIFEPNYDFDPDENRMGFYFDEALSTNRQTITPEPQRVQAYLVLFNPSNTSGVAGWECRIAPSAGAVLSSYELEGSFIDANLDPHEFTVGIGLEPIPYQSVVKLGTFQLDVWDMSAEEVVITAGPVEHPTIPGLMAWVPWDEPEVLIPILPITGRAELAWLDWEEHVGLAAPTPTSELRGRSVVLSWPNRAPEGGGYHVFRRVADGPPRQVTAYLLCSQNATVTFRDDLVNGADDQALHYSYALIVDGQERARSAEVEVGLSAVPVRATRLLQNVPNPFNPETAIHYEVAERGHVALSIYDITGRRVQVLVDGMREVGAYAPVWNGCDASGRPVASGAYYVRLETLRKTDYLKVMLIK